MTPKNTPTPWTARGTQVISHVGNGQKVVCRCATNGAIPKEEAEANARLIAVAVNRYRRFPR
jgi:hypothetical protein